MPGHASIMSARLHAEHPEDLGRDLMLSYWPNSIQLIQIFCVIILGVRVQGNEQVASHNNLASNNTCINFKICIENWLFIFIFGIQT